MRKVYISIYECKPGLIMAETIFNEYGAVVVAENSVLDAHFIRKLDNLGILKVKVYEEEGNILEANSAEVFKAQYTENVQIIKDVLHDISTGKNINLENVNHVSESIAVKINENRDIISCINQIRGIDEYTYSHCVNVSMISLLIGKWMKYDNERIKLLVQSGLLHDVGKSLVPQEIIDKPGALSIQEFEEIKKHPVLGYRLLEKIKNLDREVSYGVLMHHERSDGSGYPVGLKGSQIHEFAKIIAVADIYDAMTSNRAYRGKESPFEVFYLMENETFGVLDPIVVSAFLNNIAAYYIGDRVRLNTGDIAEIIYINPRHIAQPVVKANNEYIDLTVHKGVKIKELI